MDQISPIFSRTPRRRSRLSLYQSDYETAGEESDSSLYFSVIDEEGMESDAGNIENMMNLSNGTPCRRSLLVKSQQNQLSHTPRNKFNKRVSFNPLLKSTLCQAMPNEIAVGSNNASIDNSKQSLNIDEFHKQLCLSTTQNDSSLNLEQPTSSTIGNVIQILDSENNLSEGATTTIASDIIVNNDDEDQSLNNTIIPNFDNQAAVTNVTAQIDQICLGEAVTSDPSTSASTNSSDRNTDNLPDGK